MIDLLVVKRGCNFWTDKWETFSLCLLWKVEYGCFQYYTHEKKVMFWVQRIESFEESRHVTELVSIYHSQYLNRVRNTSFSECTMQQTIMPSIKIKTEPYLLKTITSCQLCFPLLPSNERVWHHHRNTCTHKSFKCIMQEIHRSINFHETSGVRQKSHFEQA